MKDVRLNKADSIPAISFEKKENEYFDQASLSALRDAERGLPTPEVTRRFLSLISSLRVGPIMEDKLSMAYNDLVRSVKATAPADTIGYLTDHPLNNLLTELSGRNNIVSAQEICTQLLVLSARAAEVNPDNFQVMVTEKYGAEIGQKVGNSLFVGSSAQKDLGEISERTVTNRSLDRELLRSLTR